MKYSLQKNGSILFQSIDRFLAELILEPFQKKELSSQIINDYFLQKVTKQDPLFSQDWKDYVAPELQTLFTACHEKIVTDLRALEEKNPATHLRAFVIPLDHRDAWLRILSIVRLLLASRHQICNQEFQEKDLPKLAPSQKRALLQMEIFAVMQQCLIEAEETYPFEQTDTLSQARY